MSGQVSNTFRNVPYAVYKETQTVLSEIRQQLTSFAKHSDRMHVDWKLLIFDCAACDTSNAAADIWPNLNRRETDHFFEKSVD